ncbi:MAG: hypothetical protein WA746_14010, partial [Isosphaeraceae bacterium]
MEAAISSRAELKVDLQVPMKFTGLTAMWAWTTSAIVVLLGTIAFLLGCEQMFDTDIWWHVRSGEWILTTRRVPWLDPFTFASADRPWIDLH